MTALPLVSIIVPLFNVGECVEYMLHSILNQTYKNIEIILVDDGSTDNTIEVVKNVLASCNLPWKIYKKQNGGAASARNYGISFANGEWIICPDSDDYFAAQMIEKMISAAMTADTKCVFTNYQSALYEEIDRIKFKEKSTTTYISTDMQRLFLERKAQLISPGLLLHRSICSHIRYNENCPYDEDVYYVWEVLYHVDRITFIDSNYYLYITRENSTVHSLKPENYLLASKEYRKLETRLKEQFPENRIVKYIRPKYKLGGLHVLAKNVQYPVFKHTVIADGYRKDVIGLILYPNVKLAIYACIYCVSMRLFYYISGR